MSQKTTTIGNKLVYLSQPYRASVSPLVGRETEMKLVTAAWMANTGALPLSPLLLGEPGVGKNRLVYELARRTGKELYIFQGHEDVTVEDLACSVRFSDDHLRKMDYVVSPLVAAMCLGGICFIDEIAKIRPRALALLVSVLDERRYIDSTLLGERVEAHNGFRFVAATNTADIEGNALPEFLRSRMRPVIPVGYPPREEIDQIVQKRFLRLQDRLAPLLERFWGLWRDHNSHTPPTPRDVIYVFDLALSLADYDALYGSDGRKRKEDGEAIRLDQGPVAPIIETKHLEYAFQEMFRRETPQAS
jgi:MoxR-like ATPase